MVQIEGKIFSEAIQAHAEKQLKKLVGDARVFLTTEGNNIKAQIVCGDLVTTGLDKDGYKAISEASKKIIDMQRKKKEIVNDKKGKISFGKSVANDLENVD